MKACTNSDGSFSIFGYQNCCMYSKYDYSYENHNNNVLNNTTYFK